jgi:RNA recognition motif-containing protein
MNLTRNVLREHLVEIFSNYGRVANVELLIDRRTGISKCSAFVEFTNKGEVEKAKEYMDGVRFSSLYISLPISLSSLSLCVCVMWSTNSGPYSRAYCTNAEIWLLCE